MGKPRFSIGKIPPTPGLVDQFFNDSTGVGEDGEIDARGPWNQGDPWEYVERPRSQEQRQGGGEIRGRVDDRGMSTTPEPGDAASAARRRTAGPAARRGTTDEGVAEDGEGRPVVGIGASAGGIEALIRLFEAMPSDSGMAFLVVMHLDPNRESGLAQVLGQHSDGSSRPPTAWPSSPIMSMSSRPIPR
jgi:hypothetical protein